MPDETRQIALEEITIVQEERQILALLPVTRIRPLPCQLSDKAVHPGWKSKNGRWASSKFADICRGKENTQEVGLKPETNELRSRKLAA